MVKAYEDKELSTIKTHYSQYIRNAKRRNIEFNIGFEDFYDIVKQDCFYCGASPRFIKHPTARSKRFAYVNGMDRYDNKQGYFLYNVRPCCSSCNYLKGSLNGDEFLAKVKSIAEVIYGRDTTEVNNFIREEIQG